MKPCAPNATNKPSPPKAISSPVTADETRAARKLARRDDGLASARKPPPSPPAPHDVFERHHTDHDLEHEQYGPEGRVVRGRKACCRSRGDQNARSAVIEGSADR